MQEKNFNQAEDQEMNTAQLPEEQPGAVVNEEPTPSENEVLRNENNELRDKYLRLVAEFDNFRKRTARERLELEQTAARNTITSLLSVLDDCDRAEKQMSSGSDQQSLQSGISLVFSKLRSTLQSKGVKPMESIGQEFNPDQHEAITEIPVPDESMKGKVIDELEKGYYLNDKIIRFAKVVVGK